MISSIHWFGQLKSSVVFSMLWALVAGCAPSIEESAPSTEAGAKASIPVENDEGVNSTTSIKINPKSAAIVYSGLEISTDKDREVLLPRYLELAEDLQKHIELITGVRVPVLEQDATSSAAFVFKLGVSPDSDQTELAERESRYLVTPTEVYFYGHPQVSSMTVQNALYTFLEEEVKIRWVQPGDEGIAYPKMSELELNTGAHAWTPPLVFNKIRQTFRVRKTEVALPERLKSFPEYWLSTEENNRLAEEDMMWQRRMRMGGSRPGGGHAFSGWWKKYGKTHPEYFALNKFGKREPVKMNKEEKTASWVKVCVSNPAVVQQIVEDWLPRKDLIRYVNVGVGDGVKNFCECEKCKALDVRLASENFDDIPAGSYAFPGGGSYVHLTDRYIYLANEVAREVRKHREDAMVAVYAYLTTLHPPRKLKVEPNIIVHLVPYVIPLDKTIAAELIEGWKAAGATQLAFRPNYHFKYHPMPLPIGVEKEMFDVFQMAYENGCISADYDSLMGSWNLTGMADYILAKSLAEPEQPFEYWEDQYCSAFGDASEDIKAYFRYWRTEIWEGRLKPNILNISEAGRVGNFARGLGWSIHMNYIKNYKPEGVDQYYTESDFDITDEFLQRASQKNLTADEQKRVQELTLVNHHSRLEHAAMYYRGDEGYSYSKQLLAFRNAHRTDMKMSWGGIFYVEDVWGDVCNLSLVKHLEKYPLPWIKTPFQWRFKMDEDNVGGRDKWQNLSWGETVDWKSFRVNVPWSNTYESPDVELKKKLKEYDGVGWYTFQLKIPASMREREVILYFGAVDDHCQVFVNGTLVGAHQSLTPENKNEPFEIILNQGINWEADSQTITVRVVDEGGRGGVHKESWLVSREISE